MTFCPGKVQPGTMTGGRARDLGADLDAVSARGAAAVVTLVEDHGLEALQVLGLDMEVQARHMYWLHLPVPDVSPPGPVFEAAWVSAGAGLRHRLRAGFDVVVHRKGGPGRAGMIAARLLAELGVPPERALAQVSAVRPGAIETPAQLEHVLLTHVPPEARPEASLAAARDRAIGALLGLAVGDALGTTIESSQRDSAALVTDLVCGGPFALQPGEWTDDTVTCPPETSPF